MNTVNAVKFYICSDSKTILLDMGSSSSPCKGKKLLVANTVDAAEEKHVPVCSMINDQLTVNVGSADHPMLPEHYIEWIFVQTSTCGFYHKLLPDDLPKATFPVKLEEALGVYAYCNLHGLWKAIDDIVPQFHEAVCSAEFTEGCVDA